MTNHLHISPKLKLPIDFATKTAAILAQRRKGKTYTASVLAEEMVTVKQPFVALDPTGAWWGMRAGADGQSAGLPVIVLGGQHGDVPLERTGGKLVADLVVDEPGYYVIDSSLFESGEAERQFAVDFAERLYRAKGQAGKDFPLHLFVDEADRFVPQALRKGSGETSPRLLGAFEAIVRRGGLRGLGTTLISQRAAIVNKNVLEQIDVLIALRTVGPNDQAAVLDYVRSHGTADDVRAFKESLASLDIGEAWVWEPGADPALFERVKIRARRTFNSSATPKPGEKRVEPKRLADVDLAALQKRMAATIEKAKADDPKVLRARIAELEQQLKGSKPASPAPAERVEVPMFDADAFADLEGELTKEVTESIDRLRLALGNQKGILHTYKSKCLQRNGARHGLGGTPRAAKAARIPQTSRAQPAASHAPSSSERSPELGKSGLARMMLCLAQAGSDGLSLSQLAVRSHIARKGGTFRTYLGAGKTKGWIDESGGRARITREGLNALGPFEPRTENELESWLAEFGDSGAARMLRELAAAGDDGLSLDELSERTGIARSGGTFRTYLGKLKTLELATESAGRVQLHEDLVGQAA